MYYPPLLFLIIHFQCERHPMIKVHNIAVADSSTTTTMILLPSFFSLFSQHSGESFANIHVPKPVIRSFRLISDHPLWKMRGLLFNESFHFPVRCHNCHHLFDGHFKVFFKHSNLQHKLYFSLLFSKPQNYEFENIFGGHEIDCKVSQEWCKFIWSVRNETRRFMTAM